MTYFKIDGVPLAEVRSCHWQVRGVEGRLDGVVQLTSAVVPSQSQIAAGGVVDTPLPSLPAMLHSARVEGFFHLLIPVSAVTVAVVSAGGFELQPLQGVLHGTRRRGCPGEGQAGLYQGHRLLSGWWHGRLGRNFPTITGTCHRDVRDTKRALFTDSPKLKCPFQEEPHVQVYRGARSPPVLFLARLKSLPMWRNRRHTIQNK